MQFVQAIVQDTTHLQLKRPMDLRQGEAIVVAIDVSDNIDDEYAPWALLSAQMLERAYGDSEPDYDLLISRTQGVPSPRRPQ